MARALAPPPVPHVPAKLFVVVSLTMFKPQVSQPAPLMSNANAAPARFHINIPPEGRTIRRLVAPHKFSNDWKRFSPIFQRLEKIFGPFFENKKDKKDNKNRRTKSSDNYDNFRPFFEETTWTTRDNSFKVPGGQLRPAAGREWDCGRGEKDKQERPAGAVTSDE
ncbi:MAG: hypothetical protein IKQ55_00185 [Kiritimatiellae bacterium]|nr:hypothetical protein [Kiritimatiellia bacterium]